MDTILLCSGYLPATTYIHNTFIENYMLSANGSYVKVYIYLSKCIQTGEKDLSISSLADKMDNTEKDILRALNYWEKNHLIRLAKDPGTGEITEIEILNPGNMENLPKTENNSTTVRKTVATESTDCKKQDKTDISVNQSSYNDTLETTANNEACTKETTITETACVPESTLNAVPPGDNVSSSSTKNTNAVNTDNIENIASQTERLACNEEFLWTSRVIESYINRPLSPGEIQLVSYLYGSLGFSSELLLYLYEYCISLGKTSVNYIQAVALSWDEQNIKSPEEAKNASSSYKTTYTAIAKAFAINRPLVPAEKQFAARWLDEWHMDLSVVLEACNRTMLQIQKADFRYTESIVKKWHDNNIHTMQDVKKADEDYANAKNNTNNKKHQNNPQARHQEKNQFKRFMQRETSQEELDELEKKLLAH
ncbi:MAG: DnaD domain protein [Lachnospiraceae bacterium]